MSAPGLIKASQLFLAANPLLPKEGFPSFAGCAVALKDAYGVTFLDAEAIRKGDEASIAAFKTALRISDGPPSPTIYDITESERVVAQTSGGYEFAPLDIVRVTDQGNRIEECLGSGIWKVIRNAVRPTIEVVSTDSSASVLNYGTSDETGTLVSVGGPVDIGGWVYEDELLQMFDSNSVSEDIAFVSLGVTGEEAFVGLKYSWANDGKPFLQPSPVNFGRNSTVYAKFDLTNFVGGA